MEVADDAGPALPTEQQEKVARIFKKCDEDKDGVLRKVIMWSIRGEGCEISTSWAVP